VVAGAAIASSNTAAATSSAYSAGVAAGSANTTAAYSAGVVAGAGAATTVVVVPTTYVTGAIYATVPAGAVSINKGGTTYYLSGNTWFQPAYGANGVYYHVVPAP
jgi:hypothetical protein